MEGFGWREGGKEGGRESGSDRANKANFRSKRLIQMVSVLGQVIGNVEILIIM